MDTLFPNLVAPEDVPPIAGLSYLRDYISEREERKLIEAIDHGPWDTAWQRRRQPYGDNYGTRGPAAPIPAWGTELAQRMLSEGITTIPFDHMLINEYLPGQGIALHRDYAPYGRTVVSLSLLSACVIDFRHDTRGRKEHLLLERRSVLVLSDEARYEWEHGIAHRKNDRWHGLLVPRGRRLSITFRMRQP